MVGLEAQEDKLKSNDRSLTIKYHCHGNNSDCESILLLSTVSNALHIKYSAAKALVIITTYVPCSKPQDSAKARKPGLICA